MSELFAYAVFSTRCECDKDDCQCDDPTLVVAESLASAVNAWQLQGYYQPYRIELSDTSEVILAPRFKPFAQKPKRPKPIWFDVFWRNVAQAVMLAAAAQQIRMHEPKTTEIARQLISLSDQLATTKAQLIQLRSGTASCRRCNRYL